ncbi:hypothetical protein TUM4438_00320 [Shewanella sairae]|uniref:KAP NTPase domain-containing protein n=1 Tax=Shewanella sairae TaxID=190310 RepID=A0ABQ4NZI2_9GAMM|nr:P-loop NTPase fold protein [Shewanella sairae]MCL1131722.1 KAP family NTPase [Shewanella sairae]GIU40061.1 hypothetical protein TUM4438_00320 [Shewanella sairae]
MEIDKYASRYSEWKELYSWDSCKTNRKEYGKFLCSFLTNADDSLVVNMNGSWGTGKTELLRRLYVELAEQKHSVVYIDAWESDFSNDALAVVCCELLTQLDHVSDKRNSKAKKAIVSLKKGINTCLKFTHGVAVATGELTTATASEGASLALNSITEVNGGSVSESNMLLVDKVQQNQVERVQAMKEIKKQISFLAELMHEVFGLKKQIVVLVDELDRCRPSYAVEMLEVIKHFFETKGCVFLVATDTDALQHSISAIYGVNFKSEAYLKRFFDRKVALPDVSILDYLKCQNINFDKYVDGGIEFSSYHYDLTKHIETFSLLFAQHSMSLRDIDQALQKFFASLNYVVLTRNQRIIINAVVLMNGIVEDMINSDEFVNRKSIMTGELPRVFSGLDGVINFHLSLVMKRNTKVIYLGGGGRSTLTEPKLVLSIQCHDKFVNELGFVNNDRFFIGAMISAEQEESVKYWLWEDYRKMIELSGHIQ